MSTSQLFRAYLVNVLSASFKTRILTRSPARYRLHHHGTQEKDSRTHRRVHEAKANPQTNHRCCLVGCCSRTQEEEDHHQESRSKEVGHRLQVIKTSCPKRTPKKAVPRKPAPKKPAPKTAAPTYEKWVVKADGSNPLGPAAQKKIDDRKAAEKVHKAMYSAIDARYTLDFIHSLGTMYSNGRAVGTFRDIDSFEAFLEWSKEVDEQAWEKVHKQKIGSIEAQYTSKQVDKMIEEMHEQQRRGEIPHIDDMTDFLYWKEIEKERERIIREYRAKEFKQQQQKGNGNGNGNGNGRGNKNANVSAISSPVKKAQNTIVNASPVKRVQEAVTGGSKSKSNSPQKKLNSSQKKTNSPQKKMNSNDSGYQADNEQQGVMSRTWELAANAVEAMRSAVVPE